MAHYDDGQVTFLLGDVRDVLREMPAESVNMCVTSPPYWGLRDYGTDGQLGLERTPEEYVAKMVDVFREVRRVLRSDATLWLNIGDSYAANRSYQVTDNKHIDVGNTHGARVPDGLKPKDLVGIPWMLAFALRADGWYLRQDIIWAKPNPMPESVRDRCTKAHEYLFLLSKSERYYYDADAIREPATGERWGTTVGVGRIDGPSYSGAPKTYRSGNKERKPATERGAPHDGVDGSVPWEGDSRNKRSVWNIATAPYTEAHFATFPPALVEPCILAGCPEGGTVLDPFIGSGTTALVARRLGRRAIGIDLNAEYLDMAVRRAGGQLAMEMTR